MRNAYRLAALLLSMTLAGCGGVAGNRSLDSVHQPVVERTTYAIDLRSGWSGVPEAELMRLSAWLDGLHLRYGDQVMLDDGAADDGAASASARYAVTQIVARYGLKLDPVALTARAAVPAELRVPGEMRVVVARSRAIVPGCPDWTAKSDFNPANATSSDYGCAVNGNLAAMVADPGHLLHGVGSTGDTHDGGTDGTRARKAIDLYRDGDPTGAKGLKQQSTTDEGTER